MSIVESRSLSLSLVLHAVALLVAFVGLPAILPKPPEPSPLVMTVDLVPIGAITNIKPSEKPIEKEQKAQAAKTSKPVTPSAKEKAEPEKPAEKTAEKPAEKPAPETPKDAVPLPDADKPKPADKPKDDPKAKNAEFEALLNKLRQEAKTEKSPTAKDAQTTPENKTKSDAPYDNSLPLSISEKDAIRSQFLVCWTMPAGAKDAHNLAVRVKVQLGPDGSVQSAALAPDLLGRYNSDTFFRAAADSALRAVHKCSPIKNLPPDKYSAWREMELNFDPQDLL